MKKLLYIALAVAAIACSKQQPVIDNDTPAEEQDGLITVTFSASVNESKADVTNAGVFTWSGGDRIAVYDENTGTYYPFDIVGQGGSTTASFSAQLNAADYKFTKAVYPYHLASYRTEGMSADEVVIPENPGFGTTSFIPLVADVVNGALAFDYLTAVVKVTVDRIPSRAGWVRLKSTNPISGTMSLSTKTIASEGSHNSIYVGIDENSSHTFYFPVPAGENAVTFEILDNGMDINHSAVIFTTGESNAKTVTFKAPSLYYNNVTVPVNVYARFEDPWHVANSKPYIYFANAYANTGWDAYEIPTSGDYDVAFLANGYYKIPVDLSALRVNNSTIAKIIVHINQENHVDGYCFGDMYSVKREAVNITNDLYIRVLSDYQSTAKIYIDNRSNNGGIYNMQARYTEPDTKFWGWGDFMQYTGTEFVGAGTNSFHVLEANLNTMGNGGIGLSFGGNWDYAGEYWVKPSSTENVMVLLYDTCAQTRHQNFGIAKMEINGN